MVKYADWIIRWRWWVIAGSVLVTLAFCAGLDKVRFSGDYRDFFNRNDPQLKAYELVQNAYSNDSTALVVFAPKGGTVFEPRTLEAIHRFTEAAWTFPFARRVDSLTNFQHAEVRQDDLVVRNLVKHPERLGPAELQTISKIALNEPLLVKKLVSPSGHVAGVSVSFTLPKKSESEIPTAVKALREQISTIKADFPELQITATGSLLLDNAFDEQAQADIQTLTPVMYLFMMVVIFLSLRSVLGMLTTLLVLTFSVLVAIGAAGLLDVKLTAVSVTVPTILMTIAVANCMHILLYVVQKMGAGESRRDAVHQAITINLPLIVVACGTDVLGFFSMMLTDVPPIANFGLLLGIGSIAVFVFSVTLLPALAAVLPLKGRPELHEGGLWLGKAVVRLVDRRYLIFGITLLINAAAVYFVLQNKFEDNFVNYFSEKIAFRSDTDFISHNLSGVHEVLYSVPAAQGSSVSSPEYLRNLDKFSTWLRAQPEVFNVTSLSDIVKRINRTMNGGDPAAFRVPAAADASSQLLLLFEMSLPPGLELNDQIRIDRSASKLSVVVKDISSAELLAFDQRVQQWVGQNMPAYMKTEGTGPSIMFSRIGEMNVSGTMEGYVLQILLISVVIGVLLKSFKMGVISLIPNVIPSLLAFGLWGALVGQIGLSVSVVAVLTYGIIVDDTVHSIFKYHRARRGLGMESRRAIEYVYSTSAISIFATTLVLVLGFGVLMFSNFDLNADLGIMSGLTIGIAALVDLLLVPPLLFAFDNEWQQRRAQPDGKMAVPSID
ncbi:MMPL family transporter [Cupriavidus basilensis]|uniref:MMPL family transporter n=1 Tax=Cupriavidus basilensis TaxID=68895 RepID=A0ABT6ARV1_9BURK|nr:MMPL family transporter [Cupriavidus basilensis]MDF3835358.1 MMPL family transporter [Cupriavidus basilensis]